MNPSPQPKTADHAPRGETLKTWTYDSHGNRKYALQVRKAVNGNPYLKFVEGVPQPDGSYKRFSMIVWAEDFDAFFNTLSKGREYIQQHNLKPTERSKYRQPQSPTPA